MVSVSRVRVSRIRVRVFHDTDTDDDTDFFARKSRVSDVRTCRASRSWCRCRRRGMPA